MVLTFNRVGEILQGDHDSFLWKLPHVKTMQSFLNLCYNGRWKVELILHLLTELFRRKITVVNALSFYANTCCFTVIKTRNFCLQSKKLERDLSRKRLCMNFVSNPDISLFLFTQVSSTCWKRCLFRPTFSWGYSTEFKQATSVTPLRNSVNLARVSQCRGPSWGHDMAPCGAVVVVYEM